MGDTLYVHSLIIYNACHWKVTEYVLEDVYTVACVVPVGTTLA